jgi:hypothetical protein
MASSKTGSFWLTEEVKTDAQGVAVQGTLDLGAYISVAQGLAIAVEQVDFVVQVYDTATNTYVNSFVGTTAAADQFQVDFQLSDLNPGTDLVSADDNSLIASGVVLYDAATNTQSTGTDFFPDSFGKLDESFMVVNDSLYLVGVTSGTITLAADHTIQTTCRIKCRVVKLGTKDWMAIAIQSTASDN